MSNYTQSELKKIYTTERRNWQKSASKARRKGINVEVQYPKIPKHITEGSIRSIIEKHNAWHYKTFGRPKKQSTTQQKFVTELPKYQAVKTQKKERIKQQKEPKKKRTKRSEPALPTTDYIEPIESYTDDLDETQLEALNKARNEIEEQYKLNKIREEIEEQYEYVSEEGLWVDKETGEIVPPEVITAKLTGEAADVEEYAEEFINEQLEKLSTTHENSARFLNEQFNNLTPEQKARALERLEELDETELEDLAVELYYSSASGGTKAAAKLFRIISPDNDMKTARDFMNRLYEESEDDSPYKKQAIENRRIKQDIQKYHRRMGFRY